MAAAFFMKHYYFKNHPKKVFSFLFKESQKKHLHFHFHDERKCHHCFSSFFHGYVLRQHSSKAFLYRQNLKILFSLTLFRGEELYLPPLSISGNI